jgi:signal transduction histidine kinase
MHARTRGRLAWTVAILSIVAGAFGGIWDSIEGSEADIVLTVLVVLAMVAFGVVGAVIASRTGNAVGWALLAVIASFGLYGALHAYVLFSVHVSDHLLPGTAAADAISSVVFFLTLASVVAVPLLFPTGTPRWRWSWRLYLVATAVLVGGFLVLPGELETPGAENPFAVESISGVVGLVVGVAGMSILACAIIAVVALVVRYRRSRGDERQQIRWLAYVGVAALIQLVLIFAVTGIFGEPDSGALTVLENTLFTLFMATVTLGIPVACGIALLRYRLYDLDVVIKKTVVFGVLAVAGTVVYVAIVAGIGALIGSRVSAGLSFLAAAVLAMLFQPARDRARRLADRIAYGKRATPYEVLTEFSAEVGGGYETEDVLPRMAEVLGSGTGASSAVVWLTVGRAQRPEAVWPKGTPPPAVVPDDAVEVVHRGEVLGALSVEMPPADPMNPEKRRLVEDLAAQAGLVLRNAKLIEELRASRQRLVAAQDEERRRLERNLHDGAQQQLVALAVKLRLAEGLVDRDAPRTKDLLSTVQADAQDALETLRDLARGIYPPLLADKGLPTALEAHARKTSFPVTVATDGIGRYAEDIEAAVYFSCLEALQNVAKYAEASSATVRLGEVDGRLVFDVVDDGVGFDPSATGYGTGLQGIEDRLAAIGGRLEVTSAPGRGAALSGSVPISAG